MFTALVLNLKFGIIWECHCSAAFLKAARDYLNTLTSATWIFYRVARCCQSNSIPTKRPQCHDQLCHSANWWRVYCLLKVPTHQVLYLQIEPYFQEPDNYNKYKFDVTARWHLKFHYVWDVLNISSRGSDVITASCSCLLSARERLASTRFLYLWATESLIRCRCCDYNIISVYTQVI